MYFYASNYAYIPFLCIFILFLELTIHLSIVIFQFSHTQSRIQYVYLYVSPWFLYAYMNILLFIMHEGKYFMHFSLAFSF